MIIDQLPNLASVQGTDEIPVERGTTTYKTTLQKLKALVTKADVGLENVDNVRQYSADNPPPYPVISVNGKTGAVDLTPTFLSDRGTTTSNSDITKNYTVSGNGFLIVSVSIYSASNNDYGSTGALIRKNGETLANCAHRLTSANAMTLAANASVAVPVVNGDVINTNVYCTKITAANPSTVVRNFLCFGCTVSST